MTTMTTQLPADWPFDVLRACATTSSPRGAALRRAREANGLSQSELAGLAGVSQPALAHAEAGTRHLSDPNDAAVVNALERVLKAQLDAAADAKGRPAARMAFGAYDVPKTIVAALVSGGRARARALAWSWALQVSNRVGLFGARVASYRLVPGVELGLALEGRVRGMTSEQVAHGVARAAENWTTAAAALAQVAERRLLSEVGHVLDAWGVGAEPAVAIALDVARLAA